MVLNWKAAVWVFALALLCNLQAGESADTN